MHHHTTTVLRPFFRDHLGEPVPEENFWTLWCKGRLTEADTLTIRLGATPSGLTSAHRHHPSYFYGPDALPATQPTVSKHWRQLTAPQVSHWIHNTRLMSRTQLDVVSGKCYSNIRSYTVDLIIWQLSVHNTHHHLTVSQRQNRLSCEYLCSKYAIKTPLSTFNTV